MKQLSKIARFVSSRRKYALTRITCGVVVGYIGMLGADRAFAAGPIPATTLPSGGNVVAGSATLNVNGSVLNINQSSDRAIVNWDTFSVGSGASVNFNQPSVSSSTLSRVISSNPSEIYGSITSKGSVFFINPNGILFGQGSSVNAPAAVASTLNMRDADFMAGNASFSGNSQAAITNLGRFNVTRGGSVVFIGNNISNVGSISAPGGTVGLVAGDTVSVNIGTPGATQPFAVSGGTAVSRQINNTGTIAADGGTVHLQAAALDAAATTGQYAEVMHSGAITAGGGTVRLLGQRVGLLSGSTIDTSSDASGGTVLIGGNYLGKGPEQNAEAVYMDATASIKANAISNGNGGKVVLWSDQYTEANGTIDAMGGALGGNGGFVETSSHGVLNTSARVNTLAPQGSTGMWLLDPNDITINAANSNISAGPTFTPTGGGATSSTVAAASIVAALATSNVTVSTVSAGTGLGNIVVSAPIAYTGATARTLSLIASRNVDIKAAISSTAAPLSLLVNANTAGATGYIFLNSAISTFGGDVTLAGGTAGNGTGFAVGNTELASQSNPANRPGIYFGAGGSIAAAGGNVVLRGQGGSGTGTFNSGIVLGADQTANTPISTTGSGNITLVGVAGSANTSALGVDMRSSAITAGTGTISITGTSPTAVNGTANNMGVFLVAGSITSAGAITINGTGGTSTGTNSGGIVTAGTFNIASSGGPVTLTGTGGTNSAANGVWLQSGASVTATGTGSVAITGTGGTAATGSVAGVAIDSSTVSSTNGSLSIQGTSGIANSTDLAGVILTGTTTVSTVNGALSMSGTIAASGGALSDRRRAMAISAGTVVRSTGTGSVSIFGDASASTNTAVGQQGVWIRGSVSAAGGPIAITGIGGTNGSSFNNGVQLDSTGGGVNGSVTGTGATSITITGTSSKVGAGSNDAGVSMGAVTVSTANGTIDITGISNVTSAADNLSSGITSNAIVSTGSNNAITYTADSMSVGVGSINAGTGTVTLRNLTAGIPINIGPPDVVTPGSKSLGLNSAEIGVVTAGNLIIGRNDAAASGTITVVNAVTTLAASGNVTLKSGSNITVNAAFNIASGAKNLTLQAATTATQTAAITAAGLALQSTGSYTLNNAANNVVTLATGTNVGSVSYMDSNALTVGTIGSDVGVTASGPVSISTNSANLTISNAIATTNAGTSAITLNASAATAAGTSTGGDVLLGSTLTTGAGGRSTIFTGAVATSTGVTAAVGSGSGNFRYKSDETTTNYTTALGASGIYAVYRESPTITPTVTSVTKTYDTATFSGGTMTAATGMVNGDTLAQMVAAAAWNGTAQGAKNVGAYVISQNATNALGYTVSAAGNAALTINSKPITLSGLTAQNKVYNQNTAATITGTAVYGTGAATATDNLVYSADAATLSVTSPTTGTFSQSSVGNGLAVTYSASVLSGTSSGNYTVVPSQSNLTANITPKPITLSGLTAQNKVYDTTSTATLSGTASYTTGAATAADNKVYTSDAATLTLAGPSSGTFLLSGVATANVGNALSVTFSTTGLLSGASAGNYAVIAAQSALSANITPKPITLTGLTAQNKVYDTNTVAALTGTASFVSGATTAVDNKVYASDAAGLSVSSSASGTFASSNAANGIAVTYSGTGLLSGAAAGNYSVQTSSAGTANITPKPIAITGGLTAANKVYDTTTAAVVSGSGTFTSGATTAVDNKVYAGDAVTVGASPTTGTFASSNAANGIVVTYSTAGVTLAGAQAGNYTVVAGTAGLTANITPKPITLSGLTALSKVYDTTNTATLSGTATLVSGAAAGAAGNADNKVYSADLAGLTLSNTATGTFAQSNTGTNIAVTYSGAGLLSGSAAGNYTVLPSSAGVANITGKPVVLLGLLASSKTYDTTNTATITGTASLVGGATTATDLKVFAADLAGITVTSPTAGTFSQSDAGINLAVLYSNSAILSGGNAANYTVVPAQSNLTANINLKPITIAGLSAANKVYDSTAAAVISGTGSYTSGAAAGAAGAADNKVYSIDAANVLVTSPTVGTFVIGATPTANVGNGLSVIYSPTGMLTGTKAGNYVVIPAQSALTANITPKPITLTGLTAQSKVYNTTSAATITGTAGYATGAASASDNLVYSADAASLTVSSPTAGTFVIGATPTANVGSALSVTYSASGILGGAQAGNYTVVPGQSNLTANITPKPITLTGLTAQNKVYDSSTAAALSGTAAFVSGAATASDNKVYTADAAGLTVSNTASGTFASANAANGIAVTYSGTGLLSGAAAANYTVLTSSAGVANITPKAITLSGLSAASKVYNTTTAATISGTGAYTTGAAAGAAGNADNKVYTADAATLTVASPTAGTFSQADVGSALAVTFSATGVLGGASAGNYTVIPAQSALSANITAKPITITGGLTAANKVYDQTTLAQISGSGTFTSGATTATDNKVYTGDAVTLSASPTTGSFASANAANGVAVTYSTSGATLSGAKAGNYTVVAATAGMSANITPKPITITGLTAANKVYDSTTTASVSGGGNLTSGAASAVDNKVYSGDVVSIAAGPTLGDFSQADVGNALAVTYRTTGVTLSGAQAGNYAVVAGTSGMTANITPKPITLSGLTAANKVYDTTTTATISGTGAYTTGAAAGAAGNADNKVYTVDAASLSVTSPTSGVFSQSNVGNALAVTYTAAGVLGGAKAGNYTVVPAQSVLSANITQKALTVTASNAAMVYGDLQPTFVVTPTGFAGAETAASTGFTASATSPGVHAGSYAITPTATALSNYSFSYVPGVLTINKANLTVAIPDYAKLLTENDPGFTVQPSQYSGFKNGDTNTTALSLVAPTVTRVGASIPVNNAYEVAGSYALTAAGGSASDYNIVVSYSANGSSAIKPVSFGGGAICAPGACSAFTIVGADKLLVTFGNSTGIYGTDPTTVTHSVVNGRYLDSASNTIQTLTKTTSGAVNNSIKLADSAGNYVTFDTAANAVFNSGVGTYAVDVKAGTFDATNAPGAFNTFVTTAGVYTVTPKAITATVNNATKVYDGTNYSTSAATVSYNTPLVGTDNFGAANVSGTAVNARNVGSYTTTLGGFANTAVTANYTITPVSGTFTITPATLTLGAVTDSRVYNATTSSTGVVTVANLQSGDTLSGLQQVYQSKNVLGTNGSTLAVAAGYTINDGNGGNNYTVVRTTATGTITQASLSMTGLSGVSRVYDSSTNAGLSGAAALSGVLLSDSVNLAGTPTTGSFADKNVGTNKSITASLAGLSLTGTDAANYVLTSTTTATASITPFQLTVGGLTGSTKVYDANTAIAVSGTGSLLNSFAGDTVSFASAFTPTTGVLNNKNVASGKSITVDTTGVNLAGTDAANYSISQGLTTATGAVTPLQVILGGLGGTQRVYDGTTAASLTGTANASNTIAGDVLTVSGAVTSGTYVDKNVGVNKAFASVNTTGLTLGGTDALNYSVSLGQTNAVGAVTPLEIIVGGLSGATRVYDATTAIAVSGTATASNKVAGDVLSFTGGVTSGNFANKNVANGKSITLDTSALGLAGADAGNYSIALGKTTATGAVTPLQVILGGLSGTQRVYDATTAASLTGTANATNTLAGDVLTVSGAVTSGTYVDKNVGVNKAFASVNTAGLTLGGTDALNYTVSGGQTNAVGTVTPKELIIGGLTGSTRVYDGTTSIAVSGTATASNAIAGDVVGFSGAATTGVLNTKNVGTNKPITLSAGSGLSLTGTDAANYSIVTGTTTATGNVTPLTLLYAGVTASDKVYDGTTAATLNGTIAPSNVVTGDTLTLVNAGTVTGTFDTRNVGFNKTVALNAGNLSLAGADAANYAIGTVLVGVTANITPRTVSLGGVSVADRVYDATNIATFSGTATVANAIAGDSVSLANFAANAGLFADKNVGANKAVTLDTTRVTLAGSDAANYVLVAGTAVAASITPATLKLAGVSFNDKVYDGTTAAAIVGTPSLAGVIAGDAVGYTLPATAANFVSKNAGTNVAISISLAGATLSGTDAGNYVVDSNPSGYKANINKAPLVALGTAEDKIFDFTTTATVTGLRYSGLVNGEQLAAVDLSGLSGDFTQAKPGKNLRVNITGFAPADGPGGALASNYELSSPVATATASILTFKDLGPAALAKLLSKMPKDKVVADGGATNLTTKQDRPVYLAEKDKPWNRSFATYELNLEALSDYITVRKVTPATRTYQEALKEFEQSPVVPANQVRLEGEACRDANGASYACRSAQPPAWPPVGAAGPELSGDPLTLKLAPVKLISRGDEWIVSLK